MKECGLYTRVSTDLQAETKDGSLDTQIDNLTKYVDLKHGTTDEDWIIANVYREEGKSGKNTDRPEYQRMLHDIQSGKINTVLCTKIDRVSRSLMDFYDFHNLLEAYDITFISLTENWDTSAPMGRFALKITLAAAELEREQTAERTREKMQWRAQQGLSNGGRMLGYDINPENPGIPTVNLEEKDLVNRIFETYLQVKSFHGVARTINTKGYRTKSYTSRRDKVQGGNKFADTAISRILQNSYYIGKVYHKGDLYDGQHEPIVSKDLFEKVHKIINAKKTSGSKRRKQNLHTYLLQGLVRCGDCSAYMTPYYGYNHQKRPYFYYACSRRLHAGSEACGMKPVPAEPLEDAIAKRLLQLKQDHDLVSTMVGNTSLKTSIKLQQLAKTKDTLTKQRGQIEKKIDTLVENLSVGKTQIKSVSQKIVELEEQKEQLEIEIRNLNIQITQLKKKVVSTDTLKDTLTTFSALYAQATSEEKKELMQLYINQLVWTPEKIRLALFERPIEPQKVLTTSGKVQREALSGSGGRARTYDMVVNSHPLCQLSYAGIIENIVRFALAKIGFRAISVKTRIGYSS